MNTNVEAILVRHRIERVRREPRRRTLTVATIQHLTSRMIRISFTCDDFADFASDGPDDHIKLFFPHPPGASIAGKPVMRDFTPRAFDVERGTLVIDFALHPGGPAIEWALAARPGTLLEIGGPRGSQIIPDDFDWYLLIGDETALPAIGRRVEELRANVPVITIVVVDNVDETQIFPTRASWRPQWAFRAPQCDDTNLLRAAFDAVVLPPGDGFVWIAAETSVARALRNVIVEERGHPGDWIKASGYWKRGEPDSHETIKE